MIRIAIIGRPNVGKSTLFNRLCGRRKAIVGDEPGITRDRIYGTVSWAGKEIEAVDTGGLIPGETETIPAKILEQVEVAIGGASLLLFVVDGRTGRTALDEQLLPMLRKTGRPVWVIVNKIDTVEHEPLAAGFYAFGFEEVFTVSAEHNRGIGELLDRIVERIESEPAPESDEPSEEIAVAVIGRPNVGKSSVVNRMLGMQRCMVSEIPGTTRDSVDTLLVRDGVRYRIIDTAGIRRKGRTEARTEKISVLMARKNLEQAKVALLILDAEEGVTKPDAAVGGYASESGCSVIIVLNKWDRVPKTLSSLEEHSGRVRRKMKFLGYAPIVSVSALNGQRIGKLFELIRKADEHRKIRVPTGELNNLFVPDLEREQARRRGSKRLDIRYVTQAGSDPPTFVVFTKGREPLHFSAERYLVNQIRSRYGFYAAPIRIVQKLKRPR